MLRTYGLRIGLFAVAGLAIGLTISLFMPSQYEATIQVMVDQRPVQSSRIMTPAEESITDLLESARARTVQTHVEQLTGFGVLAQASQNVHRSRNLPAFSKQELLPINLRRSISIEAATESDIITMRVRMPEKDLAQEVATQIYLAFDQQNQDLSREVGARALASLESQTEIIERQLSEVDKEIETMRSEYGVLNVDLLVQSEMTTVRSLEEAFQQARIEYAAAAGRAQVLRDRMQGIPAVVETSQSTGINTNFQRLEAELSSLRAERASMVTQWNEDSHAVRALDQRIASAEGDMRQAQQHISASSQRSLNPLYTSLSAETTQADSLAAAAAQRVGAAGSALQAKQATLARLPEVQRRMAELQRQQDSLTRTYLAYKDRLDSLTVSGRGRMSSSSMVSPAFVNPRPVSPNMPLNLTAGLVAGLLLGILSAFNSESRRSPIRNLTHLNRLAFEPSFRSIPELPAPTLALDRQPDDAFAALLANYIRSSQRPYRLGVLGVNPGCGATTAALAMANAASREGHDTLLIDTATKAGGAAQRLGLPESAEPQSPRDHLSVVRCADPRTAPVGDAALTIVDLQPFTGSAHAAPLSGQLDECILLVRAGVTRSVDFLQAQQALIDAGVRQVTVVLARTRGLDDDFSFVDAETPALTAR
jgi:uncharacterized protein involved in exopolysaccharide biosynthesis